MFLGIFFVCVFCFILFCFFPFFFCGRQFCHHFYSQLSLSAVVGAFCFCLSADFRVKRSVHVQANLPHKSARQMWRSHTYRRSPMACVNAALSSGLSAVREKADRPPRAGRKQHLQSPQIFSLEKYAYFL